MDFKEYLKIYNAQSKIDKLAKIYKNKKIVIYKAGEFLKNVIENCDLSKLNIIAIADEKFENEKTKNFYNFNCITPQYLGTLDYDVILIADTDYSRHLTVLDDHILYLTKNANKAIRPLIKLTVKNHLV